VKICSVCSRESSSEGGTCPWDGALLVELAPASFQQDELVGRTVDGRYLVEASIGRGGMGVVYRARHVVIGKPVALKVLHASVDRSEAVLQRFVREARAASEIKSRHIVETTDFGQLPSGSLYVVMELLEGIDLASALKKGLLGRRDALHVFRQVADTLEIAHARGIVHRDLKPDNVFLVRDGDDPWFVKLLDFGIAKAVHEQPATSLTETGVILGTPYYMSPEQARGEPVDGRSDLYALGVMMYRAFTGRLPFVAEAAIAVLAMHLSDPPVPPSRIAPIDARLEAVVLRCLEKRREARFASMRELSDALAALLVEASSTLPAASARREAPTVSARAGLGAGSGALPAYVAPATDAYPAAAARAGEHAGAPSSTSASLERLPTPAPSLPRSPQSASPHGTPAHPTRRVDVHEAGPHAEVASALTEPSPTSAPALAQPWPSEPTARVLVTSQAAPAHVDERRRGSVGLVIGALGLVSLGAAIALVARPSSAPGAAGDRPSSAPSEPSPKDPVGVSHPTHAPSAPSAPSASSASSAPSAGVSPIASAAPSASAAASSSARAPSAGPRPQPTPAKGPTGDLRDPFE
jgi:tRNA A-37 threonylcarbamoyl transferase component Bud32